MRRFSMLMCILFGLTARIDAQSMGLEAGEPAGTPDCIRQIDLQDFGGMVARFGDLDGDGQADVIFVQSAGQKITCITALDLNVTGHSKCTTSGHFKMYHPDLCS